MSKIRSYVMSGCSGLSFIPVEKIERYAVVRGRAHMLVMGSMIDGHAVPGTVKASTVADGDKYSIAITYTFSRFDELAHMMARNLTTKRLVAVFTDEVGRKRAAGSPAYPLKAKTDESDGSIKVTLTGETDTLSPFLPLGESFF